MKLIALILGFGLEHLATQVLHLRELRWFDTYFDFGLRKAERLPTVSALLVMLVILALPVVPVLVIDLQLSEADIRWDWSYVAFALFVVFVCLGPRDLGSEVDDYCAAIERGDADNARRILFELSESEHRETGGVEAVEEAVFIQAPNRIFGVVFWFVLLGPVGAWSFRVSDLLRRRAAFEVFRDPQLRRSAPLPLIELIHGTLLWVPVRLAALGYALAGSFDDALSGWRRHEMLGSMPVRVGNERLAAAVGIAAMKGTADIADDMASAARHAMRLVTRTLFIWLIVIAVSTLFGWAV